MMASALIAERQECLRLYGDGPLLVEGKEMCVDCGQLKHGDSTQGPVYVLMPDAPLIDDVQFLRRAQ